MTGNCPIRRRNRFRNGYVEKSYSEIVIDVGVAARKNSGN
jgi:hypothetical protein